jgi:hypothetical protein
MGNAPLCKFAIFGIFTRLDVGVRLCLRLKAPGNAAPQECKASVMRKTALTLFTLAATCTVALAAERPTRFWNLTRHTIAEFYLAPAGTTNWGANQCKNDRDGTVDADERLRITDTPPGRYDAKLVDVSKRTCIVRNLEVKAGEIFSIEERELTSCTQQ